METCFTNLIENTGTKVLVCVNGFFGGRMKENALRCRAEVFTVDFDWGKPIELNKVEESLKANPGIKVLAFVHAETSTGVLNDAGSLAALARKYDCLCIVDAVTSLGAVPVLTDTWGIDAVYSCSQKGLSCAPGLSPVSFSNKAVEYIKNRKTKVQNWFLDVGLVMQYWSGEKRTYHHTAPANAYYGMHEALNILHTEGLEKSWKRHYENHIKLKEGLEGIGLEFLVDEKFRIPHLNAVKIPRGVNDLAVRKKLLDEFNLEIGSGLGPLAGKIWRIGLMGYSSNFKNITFCVNALKQVLV
jgi:alanine-glyoxylate transaminase/serine-glyoxylate transaminase/serine-pyruvate transaminase